MLSAALASGCATLSPPERRVDRQVLKKMETVVRTPGDVTVSDAKWQGSLLTVSMQRPELCQNSSIEQVQYQPVVKQTASGVPATIGLGVAGVAAGVAGIIFAGKLPDNNSSGGMSDRTYGRIAGGILATSSLGAVLDAGRVMQESGERPAGPPQLVEETHPLGPQNPCGTAKIPPGEIKLAFGDRVVATQEVQDGSAWSVDVEALRERVCARQSDIGTLLKVGWAAGDLRQDVATYNADDCIRAQVATQQLAKARDMIQTAEGPERLTAAAPTLRVAERLVDALSPTHPRRAALSTELAAVHTIQKEKSKELLDRALANVVRSVTDRGPSLSIESASDALDLAESVPERQHDAVLSILGSFAKATPDDVEGSLKAFHVLLDRHVMIRPCAEKPNACPTWLNNTELVEALRPFPTELNRSLVAMLGAVDSATIALAKGHDAEGKNSEALRTELASLAELSRACEIATWDGGLRETCQSIARRLLNGEKALKPPAGQPVVEAR